MNSVTNDTFHLEEVYRFGYRHSQSNGQPYIRMDTALEEYLRANHLKISSTKRAFWQQGYDAAKAAKHAAESSDEITSVDGGTYWGDDDMPQRPPRDLWEYVLMRLGQTFAEDQEQLDIMGRDGWELVTVTESGAGTRAYFKRQIVGV